MKLGKLILVGLLGFCHSFVLRAQQLGSPTFPEDLPKTSIVIEIKHGETYDPIGSGVLVSLKTGEGEAVFLVTANHVIPSTGEVFFRIPDKKGEPHHHSHAGDAKVFHLDWARSAPDDIAATRMTWADADDIKAVGLMTQSAIYEDVAVGDDIFVIGCPSSVVRAEIPILNMHLPIINAVRHGIVSAKLDNECLLIDAFVFPGNSGGPVYWKPYSGLEFESKGLVTITGPKIKGREPSLIGIVLAYAPYEDVATSLQTGKPRSISEANSGLAVIVSASRIRALFKSKEIQDALRITSLPPAQPSLPSLPAGSKIN